MHTHFWRIGQKVLERRLELFRRKSAQTNGGEFLDIGCYCETITMRSSEDFQRGQFGFLSSTNLITTCYFNKGTSQLRHPDTPLPPHFAVLGTTGDRLGVAR